MLSTIWISVDEKKERMRHTVWLFLFFIFILIVLSFINAPSIGSLSSHGVTLRWTFAAILILPGIFLVYKSLDEILLLIVPPKMYSKTKLHRFVLTGITLGPLLFLGIDQLASSSSSSGNGGNNSKEAIGKITHYFGFQLYFLGVNWVGWKFLSKFLLSGLSEKEKVGIQRSGGKLLRWHFLGWSTFFLLSLYFPIWVVITCLCLTFFNNSFAFIFGRHFGKTRFSKFSSSKTVEGFFASLIVSFICFRLFMFGIFETESFKHKELSCELPTWLIWLWILGASILIHLGDQSFSVCKRILGYKNFGRMFGRQVGGFWDRFDSLAPALVFSSVVIWIFYAAKNSTIGIP
ncbi:phosphatidate cytidylyltransferase [Candidatus Mycoplasma haematominutum]|uniref:Phosphatidate cytidylyltransferase n=1 Tax=Candidatus Mycoplasma haematominutum 'Birmingham 1' TaxID=1116213 RepID=G8C392_9MOLU|nr:phosphatidate cytidylyltransferase [Candidatus Mycoplasma haematominutum]CCE66790.1 phosphatidate cytidylyltransferase [Candidatus Mycoplasma haematominutum 'Birmingham 1']